MPERVVITAKEFAKGESTFRKAQAFEFMESPADETELAAAIARTRARAAVIGVDRYSGPLYEALAVAAGNQGALIARFGVGHDGVDKALVSRYGLVLCNTPGVLDISVAEHTLWLIGSLARRIPGAERSFREGQFRAEPGRELCGQTLGVLGFGRIGRRVAAMARFGFGMRVLAVDLLTCEHLERQEGLPMEAIKAKYGIEDCRTDASFVFREADVLTVHLPFLPETRHFINAARINLMKPGAFIVNTARGPILDEAAVYDALALGRLGGAALDVFEHEPYAPVALSKDLRELPNVVLTPHIGSNTVEANRRMAEACLSNLEHFFAGNLGSVTRVLG